MRLGTCIALELAVCASAVGGVWLGVGRAIDSAGDYFTAREAYAATYSRPISSVPRMPNAQIELAPEPVLGDAPVTVFGENDDALLEPLAAAPIVRAKVNHGGTSLSLRLDFANGARASFKPEQIHPQSDPRREIAAYRMDRLLGIGHVAPAKPVKFPLTELLAAADPGTRNYVVNRINDEAKPKRGYLRGMAAWWIPEIRDAKLGGLDLHEKEAMEILIGYLQVGAQIPPQQRALVEQLATLIVFDVVIDNADRWSGSNTKVSPDRQTLYFMDNTLSFSSFRHGHDTNIKPFRRMQVFPRALIKRLRGMTLEAVRAALDLGDDPSELGPLLDDEEVRAILARTKHALDHVDDMIEKYGEEAVLALP